ncbi:AAA family ATPase [Rhizobium leguminosarum]|uniref:AAA family ATPase n=1 Tax=Rhizobium leguminosarum TaxID=384 RepID=UPI001C9691F7|nr:AAA family ATPase [Rhizobium leguminosarum]MBY5734063.1 AAA family ATPase [Rhizobium leguminosarum]
MRIHEMQLNGYASFASTDIIKFGSGINFVVGQNNTGKSALLRSLRPSLNYNPYRSASSFKAEFLTEPDQRVSAEFRRGELFGAWLRGGFDISWSFDGDPSGQARAVTDFLFQEEWTARVWRTHRELKIENSPSSSGANGTIGLYHPMPQGAKFVGYQSIGNGISNIIQARWQEACFSFDAQRYNVGLCPIDMPPLLQADAANLPAVLMRMQGNNGDLFRTLVQHMRDIFPTVRNLSVSSPNHSSNLEILVWPVIEQQNRELATNLNESGTGLSQVLAILTVAMLMDEAVIVIDEISSFLHPAAAKSLVRILESHYPNHQYIISTHSPEVIGACSPSTVHLITKTDFASSVTSLDVENIQHLRALTSELGVSMTDVFASDRIIWVEGPTEESAFPFIFEETRDDSSAERRQRAPQFTAVVATGDFTAKRNRPDLVFDIYDRLSSAASALSGAATFAFDSEGLNDDQMGDLSKRAKGRLLFLPRRMFECYLLHPPAIATVMNSSLDGAPVSPEAIDRFLIANGGISKYKAGGEWNGDWKNEKWLKKVDAANLLSDLFNNLSEARLGFSKRVHSFGILKEILAHERSHIEGLIEFVKKLVELSRKETVRY